MFADANGTLTPVNDGANTDPLLGVDLLTALNRRVTNNSEIGAQSWAVKAGKNSGYPILTVEAPKIISGADQEISANASSDLTVTSDADLADFQRVEVGKVGSSVSTLDESNYTKASGSSSTIITLKTAI